MTLTRLRAYWASHRKAVVAFATTEAGAVVLVLSTDMTWESAVATLLAAVLPAAAVHRTPNAPDLK